MPLLVAAVALVASACGSDGPDDGTGESASVEFSAAGQRGQEVFRTNGCAGCHGSSGEGAVGPPMVGLYGSDVELADGTTVVADDDYLTRAITDPGAEVVADARVPMPKNSLSDDEVADVVAYIRDLSGTPTSEGDDAAADPDTNGGLSGIIRDPAPMVDGNSIPSLTDPGTDITFQAPPGQFQLVFFGYTHCPDVCPTTLADLTVAMRKLPEADAAKVDTVMVTVDPDRDLDVLAEYVQSFIPEGEAGGTADPARLQAVADAFGVTYGVTTERRRRGRGGAQRLRLRGRRSGSTRAQLAVRHDVGCHGERPRAPVRVRAGHDRDGMTSRRTSIVPAVLVLTAAMCLGSCGNDDAADVPAISVVDSIATATYEYAIPSGAGAALDAGQPLEILPAELDAHVGDTIRIVNHDDRGHNVGPFFVGAGETLTQQFASPGDFVGICTVHPSGQFTLHVEA